MKLLLISWYFPPVNTIGAVRVGKFARFLFEHGHELGVVAGKGWGYTETMPLEFPLERVAYVKPVDMSFLANLPQRVLKPLASRVRPAPNSPLTSPIGRNAAETHNSKRPSILSGLSTFYSQLTTIPDNRAGWLGGAYRAGLRLCRDWQPDLIFASGPPFTAFLIAKRLSKHLGVPWVAELRDKWADDPYDTSPPWRAAIDQWLEKRVLGTAQALVTVTEPWAEFYRGKYDKPVATIYNGYDPLDFNVSPSSQPSPNRSHLEIGYAGSIYPGRRDPSPLFEALRLMGEAGNRFRVVFCGTDPGHVLPLADRARVRHLIEVRPGVPYKQSLAFQQQSDVLLLMQWNDPREQGNCPAKFFEYVASLRPMLILGLENGVPATIAHQRHAGICLNDPKLIAAQLQKWLDEKDQFGGVRPLPESAREGLSRNLQFEKLEKFLIETSARLAPGRPT